MIIKIDTEKKAIVVPNTFYSQIDKKNKVLEEAGALTAENKIDYVQYVKDAFSSAIDNPLLRQSDVSSHKR